MPVLPARYARGWGTRCVLRSSRRLSSRSRVGMLLGLACMASFSARCALRFFPFFLFLSILSYSNTVKSACPSPGADVRLAATPSFLAVT